jgi:hypothetical protein
VLGRNIKLVQSAVALTLLGCASCPFVELLLHWDSSIFLTGHDTESSLAFLLLLIELSFAIAKLLVFVLAAVLERLGIISCSNLIAAIRPTFSQILPATSPPVSLRI